MDGLLSDAFNALIHNPQMGIGWALSLYLLVRLNQMTDRQHKEAVKTAEVLVKIKTYLTTKFGGGL